VSFDPFEIRLAVRGVHDQEEAAALDPVDDQVVDDPAGPIRQERVLRAADVDLLDVVRQEPLQRSGHLRPLELEPAHVRDVEHAAVLAHSSVLRDHSLVLHGHLPAGERHQARAERDVALVERRPKERLHRERMLMKVGQPLRWSG